DLTASAKGTLHFEMREGALPHIVVASVPLRVRRFTGMLTLLQGEVQVQEAPWEAPSATYSVTGTASMNRKLDFRLLPEGPASEEAGGGGAPRPRRRAPAPPPRALGAL